MVRASTKDRIRVAIHNNVFLLESRYLRHRTCHFMQIVLRRQCSYLGVGDTIPLRNLQEPTGYIRLLIKSQVTSVIARYCILFRASVEVC